MKKVGTVKHFYGKIGVAIIELTGTLKAGDRIKIEHGEHSIEQTVESMQVDHEEVKSAKKGDSIGLKVAEKVLEGAIVYLAE